MDGCGSAAGRFKDEIDPTRMRHTYGVSLYCTVVLMDLTIENNIWHRGWLLPPHNATK